MPRISNHPCSRIIMPLTGAKPIRAVCDGRDQRFNLCTGEALFAVTHGWTDESWEIPHTVLGAIFHESYTRVLHIRCASPAVATLSRMVYHTSRGMNECGWHMIQAMNALAHREAYSSPQAVWILKALLAETRAELSRDPGAKKGKAYDTFTHIKEYLHEHYQELINRESVSARLGFNPSYVSRMFRLFSGQSFNAYLNQLRLEHACELLQDRRRSVGGIAGECGFAEAGYFVRCFKRHFGVTPGGYRSRHRSPG